MRALRDLMNDIIVSTDVAHTHRHTRAFGPISHKLKHLKSEEALQEDANIRTDSLKSL